MADVRIIEATDATAYANVRELLGEYAAWLGIEAEMPLLEQERSRLPGEYAPPDGAILVASVDGELAGCVALRALEPGICEMKRLWVRGTFRRDGVGRTLAIALIDRATRRGYRRMRLDTLRQMIAARRLYETLGFREIPPYNASTIPDTLYLEIELKS